MSHRSRWPTSSGRLIGTDPASKLGRDLRAVRGLIERMAAGEIDAIAFTSTPQVERLFAVCSAEQVHTALGRTHVAAIGPVVIEALAKHGLTAELSPKDSFFMKPLTSTLEEAGPKQSAYAETCPRCRKRVGPGACLRRRREPLPGACDDNIHVVDAAASRPPAQHASASW